MFLVCVMNVIVDRSTEEGEKVKKKSYTTSGLLYKRQVIYECVCACLSLSTFPFADLVRQPRETPERQEEFYLIHFGVGGR